jgi:hypothetical protein
MGLQIKGAIQSLFSIQRSLLSGVFFTCLQKYGFERFVCNINNQAGKKNIFLQFKVDIDNNWNLSLHMFSKQ